MDEETLRRILKEELNPIKESILNLEKGQVNLEKGQANLEKGQEVIIKILEDLEITNANRHMEINLKLEELKELKQVTKENCYNIAKLKAVK